jgi:hypothetical protein
VELPNEWIFKAFYQINLKIAKYAMEIWYEGEYFNRLAVLQTLANNLSNTLVCACASHASVSAHPIYQRRAVAFTYTDVLGSAVNAKAVHNTLVCESLERECNATFCPLTQQPRPYVNKVIIV